VWAHGAPMNEITLPCCGASVTLDDDAIAIDCEDCNLVLELAPDARVSQALPVPALLAAA
jgi:hypothetical protein